MKYRIKTDGRLLKAGQIVELSKWHGVTLPKNWVLVTDGTTTYTWAMDDLEPVEDVSSKPDHLRMREAWATFEISPQRNMVRGTEFGLFFAGWIAAKRDGGTDFCDHHFVVRKHSAYEMMPGVGVCIKCGLVP